MERLDASTFLKRVLMELDDLPDGFSQQLVDLENLAPTKRREEIRELISKVTRG